MEACCSRFTAAEGGARLAAAAGAQNTLAVEYAPFVATRLLHEEAYKIRGRLSAGRHRSVFVCRASRVRLAAYELNILTDLAVTHAIQYDDIDDWRTELDVKEVLVCTSLILKRILEEQILSMENINVLILDSCHLIWKDDNMQYIMKIYKQFTEDKRPRILALTYPLFSSNKKDIDTTDEKEDIKTIDTEKDKKEEEKPEVKENNREENVVVKREESEELMGVCKNIDDFPTYEKLEWKIEELEKELCCKMDLAEDIDGGKRLSSTTAKPRELIIEYSGRPPPEAFSEAYADLETYMRSSINDALEFLHEHRHDPTEIYGDELYEEFMNIPDPKLDPKQMFNQFIYVLDQLGPYAADKAAFSLLIKLEKLKIKVPYERHFLLLCLCTTLFVKIRSYADFVFSQYTSEWEKIQAFSTPKVLRFAEILEQFQPPDMGQKMIIRNRDIRDNDSKNTKVKMLSDIELCDFASLGDKIEDKVNTLASNLKDLDIETKNEQDNENDNHKNEIDSQKNEIDSQKSEIDSHKNEIDSLRNNSLLQQRGVLGFPRRAGHRLRARGRVQRSNAARVQQMQMNPDALCGIVFMKEALIAKIMFMLIVDMSRSHPRLSYLCAQYCAVEPKSPELAECQRQGRKQEDVLKKFRMHECNLLLATSALEEGIDLPRCNLVLRWDVPPSYRSYGLCRGRARAPRAATALLCTDSPHDTNTVLHNVAIYRELDQMITRKCGCGIQNEPLPVEEEQADYFTGLVKPCTPNESKNNDSDNTNDEVNNKNEDNDNEDSSKNENDSLMLDTETEDRALLNAEANGIKNVKDIELYSHKNDEASHAINKGKEGNSEVSKDELDSVKNEIDNQLSLNDDVDNHKNEQDSQLPNDNSKNSVISPNFDNNSVDRTQSDKSNLEEPYISILNNDIPVKHENDNKSTVVESNELNISIETAKKYTQNPIENKIDSDKTECDNDIVDSVCKDDIECCEKNEIDNKVNKDNSLDSKIASDSVASVDLSTAIALINRYCGKLPSDTFTRLAPQWWMEEVQLPVQDGTRTAYICTLRLPLNCPVKYNIVGHPMPTKVLARRMVALQACRILHKSGELDQQLMPIGKENFKAAEVDSANNFGVCGDINDPNDSARPGTTKRRQYYFKRTAWAFTDCQPVVDTSDSEIDSPEGAAEIPQSEDKGDPVKEVKKGTKRNMLYAIVSKLWCALPERYNTRGRRLHAPQHATQAIGILMARNEPDSLQIPAFPVYTRSGEVRVSVEHVPDADVRVSPRRGRLVRRFMRFVFAEVLRVRRRGMKLQSEGSTHNNYYIVPTIKITKEDGTSKIDIDWAFLELIYQHTEDKKHSELEKPSLWHNDEEEQDVASKVEEKKKDGKKKMENPLLRSGETFVFDAEKYREAVVTPWYRNQDQPQFFLVAEICWNLTPDSAFPSPTHTSFRHYYSNKYNVVLTQSNQPLLDVDHTSARLNLLTPRYVNRKGVALPVSSERTRRAKRDRLDQKQILVPELCRVHPFAAPLWFATVALPCVLYRINALLIADEIRRAVAIDVGLGIPKIDEKTSPGFQWPPLDFGWSLAEVLSADSEKTEKKKDEEDGGKKEKELKEKDDDPKEEEKADQQDAEEIKEKTINDILQEKEDAESGFEIGMWSNDMASSIPESTEYDEFMEPLPSNLTFCTSASGGSNWCDPIEKPKSSFNPSRTFSMADSDCSYMSSSDFDTDDSDLDSEGSEEDTDTSGFCSSKNTYASMGVRIEYKTAHEAEAVDLERRSKVAPAPLNDPADDALDRVLAQEYVTAGDAPPQYIEKFRNSVAEHKKDIIAKGHLINHDQPIKDLLPESTKENLLNKENSTKNINLEEIFPYKTDQLKIVNNQICLESIERNKRQLLNELKASLSSDEIKKLNCFSMVDVDIDSPNYVNEKVVNVGFDSKSQYEEKISQWDNAKEFKPYYEDGRGQNGKEFDFDYQPELEGHPGPSPSVILQALTMSNANDGINLERLETIGDSFLKFAITAYLYCAHPTVHEGKLSHMRSKQVSNLNLYRLGRNKRLGACMIASKFEPHDNWLPPCHRPPHTLHPTNTRTQMDSQGNSIEPPLEGTGCFIPYNLITQHSIPDKSIADCVEALIGAYLLECGPRGALLFMSWLGIRVLPRHELELPAHRGVPVPNDTQKPQSPVPPKRHQASSSSSSCSSDDDDEPAPQESFPDASWTWRGRPVGSLRPYRDSRGRWMQQIFGELKAPPSPLLRYIADPEGELEQMLSGYEALETTLQYRFRDRSLLLQALTHASHHRNRLTDCYQRLEFLGDAILDYLITRHLYCDLRRHSPGALTDLRSALVNNTIFATLAARHGFHKYFRHMSPGLNEVLTKYVKIQEENGHSISEEHYLIQEDEMEQAEDVEVPKALGDLFESVAGAIFLDSGMSLGAVWKSYVTLMGAELEAFSAAAPKSPVRELLEAEPDTAKFGKPERLADGRRVRVCVEVFGRGQFKGVGRNYRIAKGTAARCALRHLKIHRAR